MKMTTVSRFIGLICLLLLALPLQAQETRIPVVIDTDMARDDWMAIAYLLQRPDIDVIAITLSATGEASCDPGVANTMNLIAQLEHTTIPVACGRETPLLGTNTFPAEWRSTVNAMAGIALEPNPNDPIDLNAVELLRDTLADAPEPVRLITLGPLTNIAELFTADPALVDRVSMIYVMGGAFDTFGNVRYMLGGGNQWAEWNLYIDPLAAEQVIETGAPITFIPLDATDQAPVTLDFIDRLDDRSATVTSDFVLEVLTGIRDEVGMGWHSFWDQLAAVAATDETVVTIEERTIRVVTETGNQFGRVLSDPDGFPVRVALDVDVPQFEALYLDILNGDGGTPD